jgi:hypothetical protein
MMAIVITPGSDRRTPPVTVRGVRTPLLPARMHSWHWNPTAAETMSSGQM